MTKRRHLAQILTDVEMSAPFTGAMSVTNFYIKKALERLSYRTEVILTRNQFSRFIPMESAVFLEGERSEGKKKIQILFDRSLNFFSPEKSSLVQRIVFFHGFSFNFSSFVQNSQANLFCANSKYCADVLQSLIHFPSLNSTARPSKGPPVFNVPLVAPCLDYPKGYPSIGGDLPENLKRLFGNSNTYLGHAIRPEKPDPLAVASIMYYLNELGHEWNQKPMFKLFVSRKDWESIGAMSKSLFPKFRVENYIYPVPLLKNNSLYRLMRKCTFSLCYDVFPEPFGLYPLDAIHCGTPVYTNGVGNIRHLLGENCGIYISDDFKMSFGTLKTRSLAYRKVAENILSHIKGSSHKTACAMGRRAMAATYGFDNFLHSWKQALHFMESAFRPVVHPKDLICRIGPLVRSIDFEKGHVLSDYTNMVLTRSSVCLLKKVLDESIYDLGKLKSSDLRVLRELFEFGVLAAIPKGNRRG